MGEKGMGGIFNKINPEYAALLEEIWKENFIKYYNEAFFITHNKQDAQDIVQEAFEDIIKAYKSSSALYTDKERLTPYIMKIVINKSRGCMKQRFIESSRFVPTETIEEPTCNTDDDAKERLEQWDIVQRAAKRIPNTARTYFMWSLFYGFTDDEIAELMGVTRESLYTIKSRALKYIRKEIKRQERGGQK